MSKPTKTKDSNQPAISKFYGIKDIKKRKPSKQERLKFLKTEKLGQKEVNSEARPMVPSPRQPSARDSNRANRISKLKALTSNDEPKKVGGKRFIKTKHQQSNWMPCRSVLITLRRKQQ